MCFGGSGESVNHISFYMRKVFSFPARMTRPVRFAEENDTNGHVIDTADDVTYTGELTI